MSLGSETNEIGVFWDFSSLPAPPERSGYTIANNIRLIAQEFGSIKIFKAYLAIAEHSQSRGGRASDLRSELQISGISLTDVPVCNEESALEQMLTVDLLLYALDKPPASTRIVLITENPCFGYVISTLRLRSYPVIVLSSSQGHAALISQASLHFDWTAAILRATNQSASDGKLPISPPSPLAKATHQRKSGVGLNPDSSRTPQPYKPQATLAQPKPISGQNGEVEIENFLLQPQMAPVRTPRTVTPDQLLSPRYRGGSAAFPTDVPFTPSDLGPSTLPNPSKEWQPFANLEKDKSSTASTPRTVDTNGVFQNPSDSAAAQPPLFMMDGYLPKPSSTFSEARTGFTPSVQSPSSSSFQPIDSGVLAQRSERTAPPGVFSPQGPSAPLLPPISPPATRPKPSVAVPRKAVAPEFQPLVEVLRLHRAKGSYAPLRSSVALELVTTDKDIYKRAGAERFAQYSSKAVEEGIVTMGENCPAPASYTGYHLVDAIRRMAQRFGSVKLLKAYLEVSEGSVNSRSLTLRSELQVSGVSLTDCPKNGRKDAADKMMLVDMLAHAIDHPAPRTFILISGDRDFSYCLATLRLRRYKVVLVTLPNAHASLRAQASVCLDWFADVVNLVLPPPPSPTKPRRMQSISSDSSNGRYEDISANTQSNASRYYVSKVDDERVAYSGVKPTQVVDGRPSSQPQIGISATNALQGQPGAFPLPTSPIQSLKKPNRQEEPLTQTATKFFTLPERQLFQPPPRPPLRENASSFIDHRPSSASAIIGSEGLRARASEWQPRPDHPRIPSTTRSDGQYQTPAEVNPNDVFGPVVEDAAGDMASLPADDFGRKPQHITSPTLKPQKVFVKKASSPSVIPMPGPPKEQALTPDPFKPLVRQMQWYHSHGNYIVLRSTLGYDLVSRYNGVYKKAGVKKFMEYASMAEKAGIVELGGTGAESWIRLLPGWEKAGTK
ncbi:NYN domain-containing protein [Coprinopsis sp. MPI-PUGE-AT-0042]|nr:NYN domain-containing protein [Coprinopsis sp. MPI-PUGE-AT-0042]